MRALFYKFDFIKVNISYIMFIHIDFSAFIVWSLNKVSSSWNSNIIIVLSLSC